MSQVFKLSKAEEARDHYKAELHKVTPRVHFHKIIDAISLESERVRRFAFQTSVTVR